MTFDLQEYLRKSREAGHQFPINRGGLDKEALEQLGVPGLQLSMHNPSPDHRDALDEIRVRFPWLTRKRLRTLTAQRVKVRNVPSHETLEKWRRQGIELDDSVQEVKEVPIGLATLLLVARGQLDVKVFRYTGREYRRLKPLIRMGEIGQSMIDTIEEVNGLAGDPCLISAYARWLQCVLDGKKAAIQTLVCPDYSHEDGKYTFCELWDGIGLVALRAINGLGPLVKFVQEHSFDNVDVIVAMADFEADSGVTLEKVGLSRDEFIRRCRVSRDKLEHHLARLFPGMKDRIYVPMFTESIGREMWDTYRARATARIESGNLTGAFPLSSKALDFIVGKRTSLFKRWWPGLSPMEALKLQAVDYGAVGEATMNNGVAGLLLGADSVWMSPFVQNTGDTEVGAAIYMNEQKGGY